MLSVLKVQGAKPACNYFQTCPKSLHSPWIINKSVQGPCTALLELIKCANLARTYGSFRATHTSTRSLLLTVTEKQVLSMPYPQ